ncbi:D-glycero-alpha-D-manno-heptose-1,7-bisphosphate 7-phosphatase [Lonsdalea quercina]|uniref:D-glycero-alpha-D-manno-heptose-1,7-bisphosphate 7-phosphatase n=1 Tax=Lonsdalea quercina TaxID=71657 RepID=UPI00397542B6
MIISKPVRSSKKTAVFLDRDGVINREVNYCHRIEDFVFVPGVFEVLKMLQQKFDHLFIVTNQAGIGKGFYSEKQYSILTSWMISMLNDEGVNITKVYFCPHHISGIYPYNIDCDCRKPKPGMIDLAVQEYNIDVSKSIFIGDKSSDIRAAQNANLERKILMGTGHITTLEDRSLSDLFFNSMEELFCFLKQDSFPN